MERSRDDEIRKRATKIREHAGRPEGQDPAHRDKAERDVDAARNPVGNGQGDAQADDPNNEMNARGGRSKAQSPRRPKPR